MKYYADYRCNQCGHDFDKTPWRDDEIHCPRCGGEQVEANPYLLGTGSAEGLTPEDYFAVALKP